MRLLGAGGILISRMRSVRALGFYFAFVFVAGALLAPWLHSFVQVSSSLLPGLESVAAKPFPRYVNRALLVLGVIGLWPLLRAVDLRSGRDLGLSGRPDGMAQIGRGFLLGLVSLALLVFVVLVAGARIPNPDHGMAAVLARLLRAGLTALLVAPIEEFLFRGVLFGALRKTFHPSAALVLSSLIYAGLHFLQPVAPLEQIDWSSGFVVLFRMLEGFGDLDRLIPGLLNLTVAGLILGLAYQRSGTLHYSIGLHAGWIVWLKTFEFITRGAGTERGWVFGSGKLIDGWLASGVLVCLLVFISRSARQEAVQSGWKERRLFS
jgi:uncharacterized protein